MRKIVKVEGLENFDKYGLVHVVLNDGEEATVYIGGEVEVFFHRGKIKAFVKKVASKEGFVDKPH